MFDLAALIAGVLALDPQAPAVEFEGNWESWGGLSRRMAALDACLAGQGLGPDARVGVLLRNRLPHLAAVYALMASGRCLVTLNPLYPDETLAADIARLELPVVMGSAQDLARAPLRAAARASGAVVIALADDAEEEPQRLTSGRAASPGTAPGVMIEMLTSGTTGTPKRVPLTRQAFAHSFAVTLKAEGALDTAPALRPGVQVSAAPLTHIGGVWGALTAICLGRKLVLLEKFSVAGWVHAVVRHRPRAGSLTAAALRMVLDSDISREQLSSLKVITAGAAPTDPTLVDAFGARYGILVLSNYGATEFAGPVARWTLADFEANWARKRGAVGRLHHNVEARVVDAGTGETVPAGEDGVLELRSPQLIEPQRWLRTSDRARLDADGYLWITGRADGVIIRGGFKVSPEEVVRALEAHPVIREAVVVGLPDPRLGQVPAAAIMLASGAEAPSSAELSAFLRQTLAPYQTPVSFLVVDEVPRTASMKPVLPEVARLLNAAREA